jgi:hypothetical protein
MKTRLLATAVVVASAAFAAWNTAPAAAATTCTWGGTPAQPTGTFVLKTGLTNTPAAEPLEFSATARLGGGLGCVGKVTFTGQFHAGSTCNSQSWDGRVKGLPGVARFAGSGAAVLSHTSMYDDAGNLVGSEQAVVQALPGDSELTDCNTPEGFTHGHFSSTLELY